MARTKIDYGIDLGTTNSAISRMENGEVRNNQSTTRQKWKQPHLVFHLKKWNIKVGEAAYQGNMKN
jgi:molecular chaperone DnaK